ncbi:MAG: DUF3182 family protein [Variovorax sp.]|nr:MAG: DUF3182 family protein [Variovorax sp.]
MEPLVDEFPVVRVAARVLSHPGHVLGWWIDPDHYSRAHERATRLALARRIASLKGFTYAGELGSCILPPGPHYFVPSDTILDVELATSMGIRSQHDLFGGVVPFPYAATKAISHGLIAPDAKAPQAWVASLAPALAGTVLPGWTAFSLPDARRAGRELLKAGRVRVKAVRATGGRGQAVVSDPVSLDAALDELPTLATDGVVLERNLCAPRTLSVGQATVGEVRIAYYGLQRLARNHSGELVYGGSDLTVVRGDLDALCAMPLEAPLRLAIDQARRYHAAVTASFPGFLASRINYDVAQGRDDAGQWHSGVLEQSWRVGGASGAEIAAMEAFREQPERALVRASCVEVYGDVDLPPGATVYFSDIDPAVGRLTKFSFVEPHADAT